jgi:hypothetical protein
LAIVKDGASREGLAMRNVAMERRMSIIRTGESVQ